jgi:peroxiredoxin Q/BCP
VGVSTDSLATHQKFTEQHGITFPLIADDGSLKKLYSQRRTAYIIDQQGIIRFIYQGVPVNIELLLELQKLTQP